MKSALVSGNKVVSVVGTIEDEPVKSEFVVDSGIKAS